MKIAFDAKRYFFNKSGLGNYSRNSVMFLSKYFPEHEYCLYTHALGELHKDSIPQQVTTAFPHRTLCKTLPAYWRSYGITKQLKQDKPDIFHGLSNELPFNIKKANIKSVITIHDLIYYKYPQFFNFFDRKIYHKKVSRGVENATHIVAVSQQTKEDIVDIFKIDEQKITVAYQSCHPSFFSKPDQESLHKTRTKYNLPSDFILSVGTIEQRKNTLAIIKACRENKIGMPVVLVGGATPYTQQIREYVKKYRLEKWVSIIHGINFAELHAIYHLCTLFVYPSFFEGFGIPIIEALASGKPVITTQGGCFPEAGGENSLYIDPYNSDSIAAAIKEVLTDSKLSQNMITKGLEHVQNFTPKTVAQSLINVYKKI